MRVDPRVCGGAWGRIRGPMRSSGRSPRVRGSPEGGGRTYYPLGSIPACAGEPQHSEKSDVFFWVDPRVCGGARVGGQIVSVPGGRSPRVRGSLRDLSRDLGVQRSIPACAGEPPGGVVGADRGGVDPRVCGGAAADAGQGRAGQGRSPRVRGSQVADTRQPGKAGSIPACAGEPTAARRPGTLGGVDPRVCGGAGAADAQGWVEAGRSPRVRGSLYRAPLQAG